MIFNHIFQALQELSLKGFVLPAIYVKSRCHYFCLPFSYFRSILIEN
ncbi:hypothetical protein HMPREF1568_2442 [Providencia alcalifaciens PAL-3]|nr:hypothetical protein HMPREF1568_2442 [Providencia alcalifaciens PAL-3]EUC98393.1 hypothetical protein HMPREF1566_0142 [Providencia alcalifaciens PAL-1]